MFRSSGNRFKYSFTFAVDCVSNVPRKYDKIRVTLTRSSKRAKTDIGSGLGSKHRFKGEQGEMQLLCSLEKNKGGGFKEKKFKLSLIRIKKAAIRSENVIGSTFVDLAAYASPEGRTEHLNVEVPIPKAKETAIVSMRLTSEWLKDFQGEMSEGGSQTDKSVAESSEEDTAETVQKKVYEPGSRIPIVDSDDDENEGADTRQKFGPPGVKPAGTSGYPTGANRGSVVMSHQPPPDRLSRSQFQLSQGLDGMLRPGSIRGSSGRGSEAVAAAAGEEGATFARPPSISSSFQLPTQFSNPLPIDVSARGARGKNSGGVKSGVSLRFEGAAGPVEDLPNKPKPAPTAPKVRRRADPEKGGAFSWVTSVSNGCYSCRTDPRGCAGL